MSKTVRALIVGVLLAATATAPAVVDAAPSVVTSFVASGRDGAPLSCDGFRRLQRNGHDDRGWNDALVDSTTLNVLTMAPLDCRNGRFSIAFARPGTALALAWPSRAGYSTVIVDLTASGASARFEELVATQAVRDLRATRQSLGLPATLPANVDRLAAQLRKATGAARARLAWQLWDAAADATISALTTSAPSPTSRRGVTFNATRVPEDAWRDAVATVGKGGWVRLVPDVDDPITALRPLVDRAHREGLRVLVPFLDSSQMKRLDLGGWTARVNAMLAAYPDADSWEIGNEANGNWLGDGVLVKLHVAGQAVRQRAPAARTMLTLLWNLGEDVPDDATLNWLASAPPSVLDDVDDLGLSLYPEDHPLGTALDRVLRAMQVAAPRTTLTISELGYGNEDLGATWWWGSEHDMPSGRRAVARLYDAASRTHPLLGGGTFWWYFLDERDVR